MHAFPVLHRGFYPALSLLLLGIMGCAPAPKRLARPIDEVAYRAGRAQFPGAAWAAAPDPARLGWSADGLARIREYYASLESGALMVVHRGVPVLSLGEVEAHWNAQSIERHASISVGVVAAPGYLGLAGAEARHQLAGDRIRIGQLVGPSIPGFAEGRGGRDRDQRRWSDGVPPTWRRNVSYALFFAGWLRGARRGSEAQEILASSRYQVETSMLCYRVGEVTGAGAAGSRPCLSTTSGGRRNRRHIRGAGE